MSKFTMSAGTGASLLLVLLGLAGCGAESKPAPAADARPQAAPAPSAPSGTAPAAAAPAAQPAAAAPVAAAKPPAPQAASSSAKLAEEIFVSRCVTCHGAQGKGDGPGSLGLVPPPRNLSDATWQATVTDDYLEKIIAYGGIAVGKSAGMPPNPDLMAKKEVVAALRAKVRSLAKP